jgi:hypothetical protein
MKGIPAYRIISGKIRIQGISRIDGGHFEGGQGVAVAQSNQIGEQLFLPGGGDGIQIIFPVYGEFPRRHQNAAGAGQDDH